MINHSADDLDFAVSAAFLEVDLKIASLPDEKKPSWEKRARIRASELLEDDRIMQILSNFQRSTEKTDLIIYLITTLKAEYNLSDSVSALLQRYAFTGSVDGVGYIGGIFLILPEAKGIYPSENPRLEYDELKINTEFNYPHLALLGDDITKSDLKDFNKYYMTKYLDVANNLKQIKPTKTKSVNLNQMNECVKLQKLGLTQLEIANQLDIDIKLVNKYLNRNKPRGKLKNNPIISI